MSAILFAADAPDLRPSVAVDGFAIVHHVPSGMTHVLVSPAPEILGVIGPNPGPADLATIIARLAAEYDLDGDAKATVAARLTELEAAGLVWRA